MNRTEAVNQIRGKRRDRDYLGQASGTLTQSRGCPTRGRRLLDRGYDDDA